MLVLSAAVLVIVIDASNLRCDRAGSDYDDEHRRYATEHEHEGCWAANEFRSMRCTGKLTHPARLVSKQKNRNRVTNVAPLALFLSHIFLSEQLP